jgi:5-methylcytosine-specific restriction endonuclease McrA
MPSNKLSTPHLTKEDVEFLFNELRKSSVIWSGRKEALQLARKKVLVKRAKNGNPVYKYHWQCAVCKKWKRNEVEVEVDHIVEIGGVTGHCGNWNDTISRIFPRPVSEHLQVLCVACHARKTAAYSSARSRWQRKVKA